VIARTVRLPLQTGAGAASLVLWSLFFGLPFESLVFLVSLSARTKVSSSAMILPLAVAFALGAGLFVYGAYRRRPNDAVLDPRGFRIEGGKAHGLAFAWSEVDPNESKCSDMNGSSTLWVFPRTAAAVVIADTAEDDERRSLRAFLACMRAACSPEPPPARRRTTEALACAQCGALATPADAPSVRCAFCGASVAVPPDIAQRVRAAHEVAASPDAALAERLLEQPGATRIGVCLAIAIACYYGGATVALLAGSEIGAAVCALAFLAFVAAARAFVADRGALRSLVLGFAAHAPARAGEPETCRACRAPLPPPASGRTTMRCPFCNAVNLSGMDLRAEADVARSAETELRATLAERRDRRLAAWAVFGVACILLGVALWIARVYWLRRV
jgi:LSD1 subclass zinc finger protein